LLENQPRNNVGFGIYVHWPFCVSKCPYCDFCSVKLPHNLAMTEWASAYARELEYFSSMTMGKSVTSIYFGGGTPSLMEAWLVDDIIKSIKKLWDVSENVEITMEANPDSVTRDKLLAYKDVGVNRLSIGAQSLEDAALKFLGRRHNAEQAVNAIKMAGEIFPKVSFDLMYGRAKQSLVGWETELRTAIDIAKSNGVTHMSLYQLTVEEGTPFYEDFCANAFALPDEDVLADMYEITQEITKEAGFPAYEVSNHAVSGDESQHNLTYWLGGDYVGVGAGAHGRITKNNGEIEAFEEIPVPTKWVESANKTMGGGISARQVLSAEERADELLLSGLRLSDGISLASIADIVGIKGASDFVDMNAVNDICSDGFLEYSRDNLKTTTKGMPVLNSILAKISA
jgi:oxygen-independent coproporphyrinogen-3 oxidase